MYNALWRLLPGNFWVKNILFGLIVLAIIAVLFTWVFPVFETWLFPADGNTTGS